MKVFNNKVLWASIILLGVLLYNFLTYFSHQVMGGMGVLVNSDSMYLPTLFDDLIIKGGSFRNWHLTPAPYFFPDMALYFGLSLVTPNFYFVNFLFFNAQLLILFFALYKINALVIEAKLAVLLASFAIVLLYCLDYLAGSYLIRSVHHFGVFLIGLWFVFYLLKSIGNNAIGSFDFSLLVILIGLIIGSDKLFIVQFILPGLTLILLLYGLGKIEKKLVVKLLLCMGFGVILGYSLYHFLVVNPTQYHISFSVNHFTENWGVLYETIQTTIASNWLFALILLLFYVGGMVFLLNRVFNGKIFASLINDALLLLCLIIVGGLLLVLLLSSLKMMNRYLMPVYFLPLCFFPLFLIKVFRNGSKEILTRLLATTGIIFVGFLCVKLMINFKYKPDYYPAYMKCIDEFVVQNKPSGVLGNYWQSKSLTMLSRSGLVVAQVTPKLNPYNWIATSSWQKQTYDTLIINNKKSLKHQPNTDFIHEQYGLKPSVIEKCERYQLFHYETEFGEKR